MWVRGLILFLCLFSLPGFSIELEQFSINGFTSIRMDKQVDEWGYGDPNYSFDAELFDLLFNFQIGEKMRVVSNLSWNHGLEKDYGYTNLEYAFIEHTWFDELKFRIGKISTPFGLFNEFRLAKPAFYSVDIPLSTSRPDNMYSKGFSFFPSAGVGLSLKGEGTFDYDKNFEYQLFLSNGFQDSSLNPYEKDGNQSKSFTSRIRFDFNHYIRFGKSIYLDNFAHKEGVLLFSDGYDVEFNVGNLRILSELNIGTVFGTSIDSTDSKPQQVGGYLQASYTFDNGLTPYTRFETFNLNHQHPGFSGKVSENTSSVFLLGLNYEISNWYTLKTELDYYFFGKNNIYGTQTGKVNLAGEGFTEVKTSLVLGF